MLYNNPALFSVPPLIGCFGFPSLSMLFFSRKRAVFLSSVSLDPITLFKVHTQFENKQINQVLSVIILQYKVLSEDSGYLPVQV